METLFGHLATSFTPSSENIAIEALGYILGRSKSANTSLITLLQTGGTKLPDDLTFVTQVSGDDQARPDLEGLNGDHKSLCVIECKFWVGLTTNQPVTYLERLPSDGPAGVLAFIVPSARFPSLWPELVERLVNAGHAIGKRQEASDDLWHSRIDEHHSFLLLSWRGVIEGMIDTMRTARDHASVDDAKQLLGLCEKMDSDAFRPFRSEELTSPETAIRYLQFSHLAYDIGDALIEAQYCNSAVLDGRRLTVASGMGFYGRYLQHMAGTDELVFLLCFEASAWSKFQTTPIWMKIDIGSFPWVRKRLRPRAMSPHDWQEWDGHLWVPLRLEIGKERSRVVASAIQQFVQFADNLNLETAGAIP